MSPPYVKIGPARTCSFLYRHVLFRFVLFCPVLFCFILLGLVGPCWGQSPQDAPSGQDADSRASLETFNRVYQVVEAHYADPVDPDTAILDGAVRGMLSALDPFSAFFDPEQFRQLKEQQRGRVGGFGSILYVQSGKLVVLQTLAGSPSRRAGLGPGDEIVEINGRRVANLPLPDLVQLLRGIAQGVPTARLVREMRVDRKWLLRRRHQLQHLAAQARRKAPLADEVTETDERYQNAGKKRGTAFRPRRSTASTGQ